MFSRDSRLVRQPVYKFGMLTRIHSSRRKMRKTVNGSTMENNLLISKK